VDEREDVAVREAVELGFMDGEELKDLDGDTGLPVGDGELLAGGAYRQLPPHSHIPDAIHKHSLSEPVRI
jgi:hypothetical protein